MKQQRQDAEWVSDTTGPDDALTVYLKQMGAIPMLRPQQEHRLVRRLDAVRRRYRRAVLSSWYTLDRLAETFAHLQAGQQALDRRIDVVPGLDLTAEKIASRLPGHLARIGCLRRAAAGLFTRLQRAEGVKQLPLRRQIRQRLRQAIRLAERLSPRTELLDQWAAELEQRQAAFEELSRPLGRSASDRAESAKRLKALRHGMLDLLTSPEELTRQIALIRRRQAAFRQLRRDLAEANLRLVIAVAKRYRGMGLPFADLIQEGNSGLLRAVDKFDHRLGFKFGTYATWWIRQGVTRALSDQSRTVRVPTHLVRLVRDIERVQQELALSLGREPKIAEIAEATGISATEVRILRVSGHAPASLHELIGLDEEQTLVDVLTDERIPDPVETVDSQLLRERLGTALRALPARDREVIELRFGLRDGRPRSLDEVSRLYGITRERIRQIETRGLDRLRHGQRALAEFVQPA